MAAAEQKASRVPAEGTPDHFDKLLEGPCPNHTFPVKHMYKDCSLMKRFFTGGSKKWEKKKKPEAKADDAGEKEGVFQAGSRRGRCPATAADMDVDDLHQDDRHLVSRA